MKKNILFIAFMVCFCLNGMAQVTELNYQASLPVGEFHDFISKINAAGFSGQYRAPLKNKRVSMGGSLSWFYFQDKKGHTTITKPNGTAITGNINNYTNIYSLFFITQYDLKDNKEKCVPFIRGGIGCAYQDQRTDAGLYVFQEDGFQFGVNAEAGVRVSKDGYKGMTLALTYHYFPKVEDMVNTSFIGLKLGVSMKKW